MADISSNLYSWSTNAASNSPSGATAIGPGLDDNLRELQKVVRQDLASRGTNIASATTTDLGSNAGLFQNITGTTTITGFGTVSAGIWKICTFAGVLTITHNSSSLICPGGVSITTTPGSSLAAESLGSGNWKIHLYQPASNRIPFGNISGLTYANNAGDATNDIDIASGECTDSTGVYSIRVSAITKRLDAAWAVGTNQGGLDTGAIANTDYYIWAIARSDTGVTDILFSTSATSPTMPASYDYKRLIGWFRRSAAAILAFHSYEISGGGIHYQWDSPIFDIDLANTLTTTARTDTISVPTAFSVLAHINVLTADASAVSRTYISCPDQTDQAPVTTPSPIYTIYSGTSIEGIENVFVRTSSTGTIRARANIATVDTYRVVTIGFIWSRR